jgi:hypothetical protein
MPTYESFRPDDRDGFEDRWEPSIQHDQEQAIPIRELDATIAAHPETLKVADTAIEASATRAEARIETLGEMTVIRRRCPSVPWLWFPRG